jgi:response regulator RpfG family c-di-GMP phosphodiesterase
VTTVEGISIAMETLEQVEAISKSLGWTQEVVESAKKTVEQAISILSKDVSLTDALKERLSNPASKYSIHVGMLCYLNCCLSTHLDWTNNSGQLKLAMASLLHDFSIDDSYYEDIDFWNKKALDMKDKTPETIRYRMHPIDGAKLAQSLKIMPPDVDQIIMQHHEKKDGTGFPRALTSSRITPLSTLFIMVEDLVNFINRGEHLETSIKDYLVWGEYYYDQGHFKKIFEIIKQKLP